MVEVGDDINVEGVVKFVEEDCKAILIETKDGTPIWVSPRDIKTHRPNKKVRAGNNGKSRSNIPIS